MSNETKRDVFEELLEIAGNAMDQAMSAQYPSDENGCAPSGIGKAIRDILDPIEKRYDAALPDNLPVVSKDVSNAMRTYRFLWWKEFLDKAYDNELSDDEDINYKVRSESAEVALAWLLGVWRVEETGEIVKLEAEK